MQIIDYYHSGGGIPEGVCGTPSKTLAPQWSRWMNSLEKDRFSFLDMPSVNGGRTILLNLPDTVSLRVAFQIPLETLKTFPSVYCFYRALEYLDVAAVSAAVSAKLPITLRMDPCEVEPAPMPSVLTDLYGLQMIGSIDKALLTIARMLPPEPVQWSEVFFLAVNPVSYSDDFTTVISEETPDGEWMNLKSEHKEYSNAMTFHARQLKWVRRKLRPRFFLLLTLLGIMSIAFIAMLIAFLRLYRYDNAQIQTLQRDNLLLQLQIERRNDRIQLLERDLFQQKEDNAAPSGQRSK